MIHPVVVSIITLFLPGLIVSFIVFKFINLKENLSQALCIIILALPLVISAKINKSFASMGMETLGLYIVLSLISIPVGRDIARRVKRRQNKK